MWAPGAAGDRNRGIEAALLRLANPTAGARGIGRRAAARPRQPFLACGGYGSAL